MLPPRGSSADAALVIVDVPIKTPELSYEWALSGLSEIVMLLGDRYPSARTT